MAWSVGVCLAAAGWVGIAWAALRSRRSVVCLAAVEGGPPAAGVWPLISFVAPYCDQTAAVEKAVRSLLAQDYPALEVIAVDDRCRDGTGAIFERLAISDSRPA